MKNVAIKGKYIPKNKKKFLSKRTPIYRSMWERRFMIYCDRSENILEWDSESIHIPYISPKDDRWHNYYPDFYIKYKDKHDSIINAIIEIKPSFQKKWDVNVAKWDACQKHCDENNMDFKVLTEKELFLRHLTKYELEKLSNDELIWFAKKKGRHVIWPVLKDELQLDANGNLLNKDKVILFLTPRTKYELEMLSNEELIEIAKKDGWEDILALDANGNLLNREKVIQTLWRDVYTHW